MYDKTSEKCGKCRTFAKSRAMQWTLNQIVKLCLLATLEFAHGYSTDEGLTRNVSLVEKPAEQESRPRSRVEKRSPLSNQLKLTQESQVGLFPIPWITMDLRKRSFQPSKRVSMGRLCAKRAGIALHPASATSIVFDTFNASLPCVLEVTAPPPFHISVTFHPRHRMDDALQKPTMTNERECLFSISHPRDHFTRPKTVDLCSSLAAETIRRTELLSPQLVLTWTPSEGVKAEDVLALEVILATVGKGHEVCSRPDMFPCLPHQSHISKHCVGLELVCDGNKNCPFSGNDENSDLCDSERLARLNPGKFPTMRADESFHFGKGLEYFAAEMIKKLMDSKNNAPRYSEGLETSTEKSTVLWFDEDLAKNRSDSLPNVLNHYGPWGYLMLGMLICGTVLMFCGLWECCCRRPKTAPSSNGPTLLIINQGAQGAEGLEVPATPGPPRYEDLDQPPSYSTLFPSTKLMTSSSEEVNSMDRPSSSHSGGDSRIFTIDCPVTDGSPKSSES